MKRIISALLLILIIVASCASLLSCGNTPYVEGEGELNIVTSCFPAFDFAREVAGDKATITLLQANGEDMHDFTPTTATLNALNDADIFICVGGSSDETWVNDVLENCKNPDLAVIKLMDYATAATPALSGHNSGEYCAENHSDITYGSIIGSLQGNINGDKDYAGSVGGENESASSGTSEDTSSSASDNKELTGSYDTELGEGELEYVYVAKDGNVTEIKPGENGAGDNYFVIVGGTNGNSGNVSQYVPSEGSSVTVGGTSGDGLSFEYVTGSGISGILSGTAASESDEHVWTSLKSVVKMVEAIAEACVTVDGENSEYYHTRAQGFKSRLKTLDLELEKAVAASAHKTLVFADRFPFVYLTQDYGLCYYSAYAGCSSEAFAGFETVARLVETVKSLSLPAIITLENPNDELAQTVAELTENEQIKIIQLNSLQNVTKAQIENDGLTYIDVMQKNIEALKEALK